MKILLVNPNTTSSMTRKIETVARTVAAEDVEITAVNPSSGPRSVEGYLDEMLSVQGILTEIGQAREMDAYVIACFDDTGLDACRCLTDAPVTGIGEAAFHVASLLASKFTVITTLSRSVPAIEENLRKYGLWRRCAKVRASEIPVLDLEASDPDALSRISREIEKAKAEDKADAIVLGCAGMADLAGRLTREHELPVLDGVVCAVKLCESLVGLGLKTSKAGPYVFPEKGQ